MNDLLEKIPHREELPGLDVRFSGEHLEKSYSILAERKASCNKIVPSLEEAIRRSGLEDGMTISFHHHFRNGDNIVLLVVDKLAEMGFRNQTLAASSLTDCHAGLIPHIQSGVIRRIETSGLRGELAAAISNGLMDVPVVFRSHGGRARAIETGALKIDVAFLGAPSCDPCGNANGYSRDMEGGATRFTKNPKELTIAQRATEVIAASDVFRDGFSIQMGSGGASLAVGQFLREKMLRRNITASFALGGITGSVVDLHEEGIIRKILDVQSFDLRAAESLKNNRFRQQISASYYASPSDPGCAVNLLNVAVLSALEVDTGFNVNVLTGSDGVIRGAIGGHPDTAYGAALAIVVCPLTRGRIPCVVDRVNTVVTPGKTVDVVVTDCGVAVNPRRSRLRRRLEDAGLPVCDIAELQEKARQIVGTPEPIRYKDRVVGVVTYRDGSVLDLIRQVEE